MEQRKNMGNVDSMIVSSNHIQHQIDFILILMNGGVSPWKYPIRTTTLNINQSITMFKTHCPTLIQIHHRTCYPG